MIQKSELKAFGALTQRFRTSRALFTWRLSRYGIPRTLQLRSGSLGDFGVVAQIFIDRDYELNGFAQNSKLKALYDQMVSKGKTPLIFDAGANIGASVVWFASQFPNAAIIAIEPEPANCSLLRKNCEALNYCLVEGGIGSDDGTGFIEDDDQDDWSFRLAASGDREVRIVSASRLVSEHASDAAWPFIFKIDIEGGENELFAQNIEWLKHFPLVVIELHDWMLPGKANSRNFLGAISSLDFDFVFKGENAFCFNNALLGGALSAREVDQP